MKNVQSLQIKGLFDDESLELTYEAILAFTPVSPYTITLPLKMIVEVRLHLKGRVMIMVTKQMTMKKYDKKIVCKNVICKNKCYK